MELTSLARLRRYCGKLADNADNNNALQVLLLAASANIEQHLCREIELKERTEYFNSEAGQRLYYTKAYPIIEVDSIFSTVTGKFSEGIEETDYFIDYSQSGVVLRRTLGRYMNSVQLVYTGGLAADPVRSTFVIGTLGNTPFEENQYVRGSRSRAVGKVISNDPDTEIIIENLYGKFRIGDVLSAYQQEDLSGTVITATAGTITEITAQSLVEGHPALAMACEFEVNFLYRNSTNSSLWVQGTNKEGTTKNLNDSEYPLRPETRMMLRGYERYLT
jgi:hypothetical protein